MQAAGVAEERQTATARVEELVGALEALPDQAAASLARELVQIVLDRHGAALAAMLDTIGGEPTGSRLIETLLRDDDVRGVLLLHGLHPAGLEARVREALERLHPHLGVQGVAVEAVEFEEARVRVRLGLSDAGRYAGHSSDESAEAIRREVEAAVFAAAPDVAELRCEGLPGRITLVPVSSIKVRRRIEGALS